MNINEECDFVFTSIVIAFEVYTLFRETVKIF